MKELYIGLDVHSKKTVYVIMNKKGKVIFKGEVATNSISIETLLNKLEIPKNTKIGLESGTQSNWLSRLLNGFGMEAIVVDAHEVRKKARRKNQKSDLRDAYEICDGIRKDYYTSIVFIPSREIESLRIILSRRKHFVKMRTSEINSAKFLLRYNGYKTGDWKLKSNKNWQKLLEEYKSSNFIEYIRMHYIIWQQCNEHISTLEKELETELNRHEEIDNLLQSMPGVGEIVSSSFIASIGEIERFAKSNNVASYLGLVPSGYDSGEKQRHGKITKSGPSYVRAALCEAAHHAAMPGHPLNYFWKKIFFKKGYRKAVIAVAHKMAKILYRMWKDNEVFNKDKLNIPEKRRKAIKHYKPVKVY